jgi:glycerophosphoryl diester phosphodiesterase
MPPATRTRPATDARPVTGVVIVAHRGVAAGYPENTLAAFRGSVSLGFRAIEIDLRATADGHIVIMHNETVDQTTNGTGEVDKLRLAGSRRRLTLIPASHR